MTNLCIAKNANVSKWKLIGERDHCNRFYTDSFMSIIIIIIIITIIIIIVI